MGLVLAVAGIVRSLGTPASQPVVAFELFISLLVPTGLATGGYWLANRNVSPDVRWRAATRVSIGIVVACALAAWLTGYVALEGGTIRDPLSLTTTLAAVGGATGFVTAVRDPQGVASAGSNDSNGASRATETELPVPTEPSDSIAPSTATADASPGSTMERPTAAAATATAAIDPPTADVATTDTPSLGAAANPEPTRTTGTATTAETGTATAVWNDTGPMGRTAAPARPLQSPERNAIDEPEPDAFEEPALDAFGATVPDAFDGSVGSHDPLDSPTPAPDRGVDAVASVPSTAEAVLEVLRNERARLALAVLYHEWDGEERSVDALARAVSYHTEDSVDAVAAGLRHATLPRLLEIRAVDWDRYADRVAAPDHAVFEEGVREASVLLESFEPGTR